MQKKIRIRATLESRRVFLYNDPGTSLGVDEFRLAFFHLIPEVSSDPTDASLPQGTIPAAAA
jgi:hypothetical protein